MFAEYLLSEKKLTTGQRTENHQYPGLLKMRDFIFVQQILLIVSSRPSILLGVQVRQDTHNFQSCALTADLEAEVKCE